MLSESSVPGRRRRGAAFLLSVLAWVLGFGMPAMATAPKSPVEHPDVKSSYVVVMDAQNASVLYSRKADVAVPIASITKLMTALVVLEADQPMDEIIQITKADRDTEKGTGSRLPLGTKLTRKDALILALMASENRAANALGRHYPGGVDKFVKAMNAKARELGMTRTRFVEPTGLSARNVSSASDIARLVIAADEYPLIRKYSTQESHTLKTPKFQLAYRNSNLLVTKSDWDITVQKTGYISEAGRCLAIKANIKNRPIVMVLLNSQGSLTRIADARRIRRWMEGSPDLLDVIDHEPGGGHSRSSALKN